MIPSFISYLNQAFDSFGKYDNDSKKWTVSFEDVYESCSKYLNEYWAKEVVKAKKTQTSECVNLLYSLCCVLEEKAVFNQNCFEKADKELFNLAKDWLKGWGYEIKL